jgi:UDP-N-acetylenolpyruvoylglucosamine reductase
MRGAFEMEIFEQQIQDLRSKISGDVLTAESEGYDKARQLWDLSIDQRPFIIVVAGSVSDIVEAVLFASKMDLKIAVCNTGHGHALPAQNSLLIVTSRMTNVIVDATAQTAWIEAGATWNKVLALSQSKGLAPLMGSSSGVGAIGYTLGGGMGWLARKYGLAIDSVKIFELVTPDGRRVRASETENRELFWALRGGGAAFGVVTGMEIRLYPVTTVFGGSLIYPREAASEVFARYKEWIASASDELTSSVSITNFPTLPIVPEFLQGKSVVIVRGCYCGPVSEGRALLQPWLDWMPPMVNLFKEMPFSDADAISEDPVDPLPILATNFIIRELSEAAISTLIKLAFPGQEATPLLFAEIHHAGGAISRLDREATAYSQRDASFILKLIGFVPTPEMKESFLSIVNHIQNELRPYSTGGVYLNFLTGDEKWAHTKDAYSPETYQKLRKIKAQYDPDNRLCFSLNIPAGG